MKIFNNFWKILKCLYRSQRNQNNLGNYITYSYCQYKLFGENVKLLNFFLYLSYNENINECIWKLIFYKVLHFSAVFLSIFSILIF